MINAIEACISNTFFGNLINGRKTRLTKYLREVSDSKIGKKGFGYGSHSS